VLHQAYTAEGKYEGIEAFALSLFQKTAVTHARQKTFRKVIRSGILRVCGHRRNPQKLATQDLNQE
jgi:hypothetical protein